MGSLAVTLMKGIVCFGDDGACGPDEGAVALSSNEGKKGRYYVPN